MQRLLRSSWILLLGPFSSLVVALLEAVLAALTASETPAIAPSSGISAIATRSYFSECHPTTYQLSLFASTTELTVAVRFCEFSTRALITSLEYIPWYI